MLTWGVITKGEGLRKAGYINPGPIPPDMFLRAVFDTWDKSSGMVLRIVQFLPLMSTGALITLPCATDQP